MTHDRRLKLVAFVLATLVGTAVLTGCAHRRYRYVACASEVTEQAQKSGSSGSSGGSKSGSSGGSKSSPAPKAPSAPKGAPKPPTGQNKSTPPANGKPASPPKAQSSKVTPPGEKSYKPPRSDVKPPTKQVTAAQKAAPERVSRNGSYRSPVTHHVYVYHDTSYYSSPLYILDLFDPYNPANYLNPLSPFFGRPFNLVDAC